MTASFSNLQGLFTIWQYIEWFYNHESGDEQIEVE